MDLQPQRATDHTAHIYRNDSITLTRFVVLAKYMALLGQRGIGLPSMSLLFTTTRIASVARSPGKIHAIIAHHLFPMQGAVFAKS